MLNPGVVNPKVGLLISQTCSCDCFEALRGPRHQVHTHLSVALFAAFFPCSTKFAYCKWWLDAVETWQQGYESVHFAARYSFLHCWPGLDEAQTKWQCPCGGYIVEPFKHLLHATADPQFLALEFAQDNTVKDCMWLLRSSSKRQLHRLHKKTLHIYIHVHFYMHCYSMYGLWKKEGGNDGVSIAWELFMLQQEAIYIAINHA